MAKGLKPLESCQIVISFCCMKFFERNFLENLHPSRKPIAAGIYPLPSKRPYAGGNTLKRPRPSALGNPP